MKLFATLIFLLPSTALLSDDSQPVPSPRTALLMGAWDYSDPLFPRLPEAGIHGDLIRMKAKLETLGFHVTMVENPDIAKAEKAVDDFGARLVPRAPNDTPYRTSLFYFSGHGAEHEGHNYLIPVGKTNIGPGADLKVKALAVDRILNRMESSGIAVNLVFLDCCRNGLNKGQSGLAPMTAKGAMIGFATRSGEEAETKASGSPYTSALLSHLGDAGRSLTDMHSLVTQDLVNGRSSQRPGFYNDISGIYHMVPRSGPNLTTPDDYVALRVFRELHAASKTDPYVNLLGMKFVPVPDTKVLFCIHETRNSDYAVYAQENTGADARWKNDAGQGRERHPVTSVSHEDAIAFCDWLSKKEKHCIFRLPTDQEWSFALGQGLVFLEGKANASPAQKSLMAGAQFPWGKDYPPPADAGNYDVTNVADGFGFETAPVMSFAPNVLGIYDLGGNVWEWCSDWWDETQQYRVLRGASWYNGTATVLRSGHRSNDRPTYRGSVNGFRVVVEVPGS